jgi:hypothetical protein
MDIDHFNIPTEACSPSKDLRKRKAGIADRGITPKVTVSPGCIMLVRSELEQGDGDEACKRHFHESRVPGRA